jgi:hypothetical protein
MKSVGYLIAVALLLAAVRMSDAESIRWPALPSKGFISGRVANFQDAKDGNAIFVTEDHGKTIGKPIFITIPQYAYWTDGSGKKVPVIVVQAEEAKGIRIIGFRDANGASHAATEAEMEFLGTSHPK